MGQGEVLASQAVQETTGDGFARGESDGVHQNVEAVPLLAELLETRGDLRIVGHVQRQHDVAAVFGGRFFDTRFQTIVLVGEGQFRAFPVHGFGDTRGDGTVAGDAGDECALALQETHGFSRLLDNGPILPLFPRRLFRAQGRLISRRYRRPVSESSLAAAPPCWPGRCGPATAAVAGRSGARWSRPTRRGAQCAKP